MIQYEKHGDAYICLEDDPYFSPRYRKIQTVPKDYPSNGANLVEDLIPTAWFHHDLGCETGEWDNGTKMCNRELSFIYYDILRYYGVPWWRCAARGIGTFIGGGGAARKNGMWRVKNG